MLSVVVSRRARGAGVFILTLLAIELLDEFVYSTREAAWPLIRDELALSYFQIGLLLTIPNYVGMVIELALGVLADVWKRRALILGGGVVFTLALALLAFSPNFGLLMLAFTMSSPASGAFVGLAQAALMDHQPERHEQNMARWTLAGSVGVVIGPLALGLSVAVGLGWRGQFLALALLMALLVFLARRFSFPNGHQEHEEQIGLVQGFRNALTALRKWTVLRWLILLQFSDLLMDVLLAYLALYFVDVVGVSQGQAGIAVAVWTGVGLVGDVLLIPLLERVRGLSYLRVSAALEFVLFPAFLLVENLALKLVILGALGFFNSGWYSILAGQLYASMPGQSGTVMTVGNVVGFIGGIMPFVVGLLAQQLGLGTAIWFLLLGPIALLIGLPRKSS